MNKPRLVFFDIETSPNIVTTFNIKDKNPIHYQNIQQERYIICASWKWSDESTVHSISVDPKSPKDDRHVLAKMLNVFAEADGVVAHYGDGFDTPFINTRLAFHRIKPLAPAVQIDTYKMAKRKFLFNSNKLDYLGQYLGFGAKTSIGYSTWLGCMKGNKKDIEYMVKYNKRDVILLEKVYNTLSIYCKPGINYSLFSGNCKHCSGTHLTKRGYVITKTKRTQRYQCQDCGAWQ